MNVINIVLSFVMCVAVAFLIYTLIKNDDSKEHFTEEEQPADKVEEEETDKDYQSRLNVMKVFDAVLNRKPSIDEITSFAKIPNEQDMVTEVYEKYQDEIKEGLETKTVRSSAMKEAKQTNKETAKNVVSKIDTLSNNEETSVGAKAMTTIENISTTTGGNVVIEAPTIQSVVSDILQHQGKIDNLNIELRKSLSTLDKMLGGTTSTTTTSKSIAA